MQAHDIFRFIAKFLNFHSTVSFELILIQIQINLSIQNRFLKFISRHKEKITTYTFINMYVCIVEIKNVIIP